ncbi:alanine/ornithine racemase family PLP-dependent enzyme [Natronoglomus mannanivorans]|uniref:Alanine/ornithine racemase family PLP-dependent enzyme n=1 Tax=Natronoglomus mannanivorans TaxID=2979990 RepID=A0AAP2YV33_9EURY|nr:alanine/ornithine racemase family PLP-dependent enzyme [Halobacteria archaeon AArc-xg1-1]
MIETPRLDAERAPVVTVRPAVLERNARRVADRFDGELVGVTKGVGGDPRVARAMLAGGATAIADSRLANLRRLRETADVECECHLLRTPMRSEVENVVRDVDVSMQSEPSILRAIGAAASRRGVDHRVVLAVDVGDRREGIMPDDLESTLATVEAFDGVELVGIAAHVGSLNGVVPTAESAAEFVEIVERAEEAVGRPLPMRSGGSSNALSLCFAGDLPTEVSHLRVGEAILLGTDPATGEVLPGFETDAFVLSADVIECKSKPSTPDGTIRRDAFGESPTVEDRGPRERAIVALGRVDVAVEGLVPVRDGIDVLGASSDHTVLDVTDARETIRPGETITFGLEYGALARGFGSQYVATAYE